MSAELFQLASIAASYPGPETRERLSRLVATFGADRLEVAPLVAYLAGQGEELESESVRLFDHGSAENPLHETGYGRDRSLAIGERLADVAGFYRAFGVDPVGEERADHLAVELEFYAWLLLKGAYLAETGDAEGVAIVLDARGKFLRDHLAPLADAVSRRPGIEAHPAFGPLFAWIGSLVAEECDEEAITFEALDHLPARIEPDEVTCAVPANPPGGGRLPVLAG